MNELKKLQKWFIDNCDGDWEHTFGVKLVTLDNPGWMLTVDLENTNLDGLNFKTIQENYESETDWILCRVEDGVFYGYGGAGQADRLVKIFLEQAGSWVNRKGSSGPTI